MNRIAHQRPSGAMVVAIVAIVIATAGSATAAGLITSAKIKNNTVTGADIRDGTVASKDVRNRSLVADDFRPGQLPTGPRGLTGAAGRTGLAGPPGAAGRDGVVRLEYPHDAAVLANGNSQDLAVGCPPGTFVVGGDAGAFDVVTGDAVGNLVVRNQSIAGPDGYTAHFDNELASGNDAQTFIDAICANANDVVFKPNPPER
jgi:hypothetical protein